METDTIKPKTPPKPPKRTVSALTPSDSPSQPITEETRETASAPTTSLLTGHPSPSPRAVRVKPPNMGKIVTSMLYRKNTLNSSSMQEESLESADHQPEAASMADVPTETQAEDTQLKSCDDSGENLNTTPSVDSRDACHQNTGEISASVRVDKMAEVTNAPEEEPVRAAGSNLYMEMKQERASAAGNNRKRRSGGQYCYCLFI